MNLPQPLSTHDLAIAEAQAEHALDDAYYGKFEIAKLRASPDNRKRFNEQALQELAESIKTMGVAQAILIRPVTPTADAPEPFEIVAGERRFRASKIAGKTEIPALCRKLSNLDAAKIRILENLQREDPHPMEEAEGYQLLMLQHGFTADQLVEEVKKSRAYIYARLKLCALTSAVREQFLDNKLSASTALLVARIPVPALQIKAAQEIMNPYGNGVPMSARDAASHIQGRYMLKLTTAVFSITDAKLLATAGACTKCPKLTGNQPEVFEGVDANVCTDPDCFSEKRAAHSAALLVQANKQGIPVLEGDEAAQTMSRRYSHDSELVTADMNLWYFKRNSPSTQNNGYVSDFLRGAALPPVASYAKKDDGNLTPLYKRTDVQAALEACEACETVEAHAERMAVVKATDPVAAAKQEAEQKKAQARQALIDQENSYRITLYKQLRQHASVGALGLSSLREFAKASAEEYGLNESVHDLYDSDVSTDLESYIDTADAGALQLLLIDLVLGHHLEIGPYDLMNDGSVDDEDGFATVVAMARHEGINVDAVRAEIFVPVGTDQPERIEPIPETGTESLPAAVNTPAMEDALARDQVEQQATTTADRGSPSAAVVTVRYRNPNDPGQAWTGRGKQPKWVTNWLESGKSLDSLRVPTQAAAEQEGSDQQQTDTAPTDHIDKPAPTAATPESSDQIDSMVSGVETPAADDNQGDGELLSEQMAEATQAETDNAVQTSARAKKAKAKPTRAGKTSK